VAAHGGWSRLRTCMAALLAAGGAGLSGVAMTIPAIAQPHPIRHVVVLYLENHSFDDVLGFWCNRHHRRCPAGGMPSSVTLSDKATVIPGVLPDIVPDVSHTVTAQQVAINGGKMDAWQKVPGCTFKTGYACIGGYTPEQVPNLVALADRFAISDRTFSMAGSPSWGGHLYAVMASLHGFDGGNPVPTRGVTKGPGWGCDSNKVARWKTPGGTFKLVPSCIPDNSIGLPNGGAFRATPVKHAATIMDRLHAAGLSWRIYGQPTPPINSTPIAAGYGWDICPSFAKCLFTRQGANNVPSTTFVDDAMSGKLPSFAIVTPGGKDARFSEHNGLSMTAGDDWLGQVAAAVMNGPQWRSTALFITWDDCGCFYDHVRPGVNPDGTRQGPRTPLVIVSPFAKQGYTDTTATTFAGILAYTEHNFGLPPLGVNDRKAYAFSNAFNYRQRPLQPARMVYRPWPRAAYHVDMRVTNDDT